MKLSSLPDGLKGSDKEFVGALARGIAVLEAFDADHVEMTLSQVAARTHMTAATARRCLHTLSVLGYVGMRQRNYFLTGRVLTLTLGYLDGNRVADLMADEVQKLVDRFGDAASVAVLSGQDVVYIHTVGRPFSVRPNARVGVRYPAHATSLGKAILAFSDNVVVDAFFDDGPLQSLTDRTIADSEELREELRTVRRRGYAVSIDELDYGIASIAVPIINKDGVSVAALNSSGYSVRQSHETLVDNRLDALLSAAEVLSKKLDAPSL